MKCSWPGTCIKMFWPYLPRGGSRARPNRSRGSLLQKTSDQKATATNWIPSNDLEACYEVLFLVPFCSLIFDPWINLITEVLIVLRWAISAPWGSSFGSRTFLVVTRFVLQVTHTFLRMLAFWFLLTFYILQKSMEVIDNSLLYTFLVSRGVLDIVERDHLFSISMFWPCQNIHSFRKIF